MNKSKKSKKRSEKSVFLNEAVTKSNARTILKHFEKMLGQKLGLILIDGKMFMSLYDENYRIEIPIEISTAASSCTDIEISYASKKYESKAIVLKERHSMLLDDFAYWLRLDIKEVEYCCCKEFVASLVKKSKTNWEIFNGKKWVHIDPYEFLINCDLITRNII